MACQSLMTKPSKPIRSLRTPLIISALACIFTGPWSSPRMSSEEYEGMTVPTPRFTDSANGERCTASSSSRLTLVMPWSVVYEPVVAEPYSVPPSPTKCLALPSTLSLRCRSLPEGLPCMPWMTVSMASTRAGSSPKAS